MSGKRGSEQATAVTGSPQKVKGTANRMNPVRVGLDDGYAYTKIALPDGRLTAIPSSARIGRSCVTSIKTGQQSIFEYETDATVYSVGTLDGAPTRFEGYAASGLNRVIVQHALQQAGLAGRCVHAVSGLPVSAFYRPTGEYRHEAIANKKNNLELSVQPLSGALSADIAFHRVIPEALAAWYDYVVTDHDGQAVLDEQRVSVPIAVVDIGGRTTDTVVIREQSILHSSSGSFQYGMLDVTEAVAHAIQVRYDLEVIAAHLVTHAIEHGIVRLYGKNHDVAAEVRAAKEELIERLHGEVRRQLGLGMELDRVLFVGGGSIALAQDIRDWFPNQVMAEHPGFANARGMLKYLRYVCEEPDAP